MNKNTSANNSSEIVQPSSSTSELALIALAPFWLLNAGTAKKLGQRSAGILNYHILAGDSRRDLLIAITRNEGAGFFSKERVHFRTIVTCLEKYKSGVPFVQRG